MLLNEYNEERHLKNTYEQGKPTAKKKVLKKASASEYP